MVRTADRNLLFGILALQMDFISRDQLVAGMNAWVLDKERALGDVLLDQGALSAPRRQLLDALVEEHVAAHGGSPEQSLAALSPALPAALPAELSTVNEPDLHATLSRLEASGRPGRADPPTPLERAPADSMATQESMAAPRADAPTRYRIVRPHARGGLGEVFVAHDQELQREVALKEIQARHADDPHSRARFVLEAEITGGLEHPGIVPVYGLGCYPDGRPFYAMRFIRGRSFKEAVDAFHQAGVTHKNSRLAFRQLASHLLAVCHAIEYAHNRGILHRDLKPSNIMLGKYGETLVVDWGLAKTVGTGHEAAGRGATGGGGGERVGPEPPAPGGAATEEAPLRPSTPPGASETVAGSAIGTPQFMSPEQAAGRLDLVGRASDIYSLGATLYYLLTGKPPVDAPDIPSTLRRVQAGDVRPPRQVNPHASRALAAVCLKAMALQPAQRYASVCWAP